MMETPRYIAELAAKQLTGTLTVEEREVLARWADSNPAYRVWLDTLTWERLTEMLEAHAAYQPVDNVWDNPALWQHIEASLPHRSKPLYRTSVFRWAVAVAALLLMATGLFFWNRGVEGNGQQQVAAIAADILPGGNRATLTLADGRPIDLSEAQQGIIVGDEINYTDGSDVVDAGKESLLSDVSRLMSLSTPKGGTYQVTLPDGSRVWLNAASTLKYPSRFPAEGRVVELTGEAYFDIQPVPVSKSAFQPFKVITAGQTVEVLGTEFNISAYTDEPETKTTLVEGKVTVGTTGTSVLLVPGEQGTLKTNSFTKQQVDVAQYTAWREGRFAFTGKPFTQVMAEFARWYDVEVRYEGTVPNESLVGGAYRTDDFGAVLRLLESGGIPYRVDGRTLIINPKQEDNN